VEALVGVEGSRTVFRGVEITATASIAVIASASGYWPSVHH
jgi:hypothetical protein